MKIDTLDAINNTVKEAKAAVENEMGKDMWAEGKPTIIKPLGGNQFILMSYEDDIETGEREFKVKVSDSLVILPSSEDTLSIFGNDEDE